MPPILRSLFFFTTYPAARTPRITRHRNGSRRSATCTFSTKVGTIFAKQKKIGVIPANAQLTPWPDSLQKWDTLNANEKKLYVRQADIFAAYAAYTDNEIGRVIQTVEDLGKLNNTLVIYIAGDNGTSAEGSTIGTPFDMAAIQAINVPVQEQLK